MQRKGFPRYIALAATVDDGAPRWLPRRQRGIRARARQASAPTSACTELTRVIPGYPRKSLPTRPRVKPRASVARRRVRASEVAAHWGSPSRKRRCCCAARKVSGWARGVARASPLRSGSLGFLASAVARVPAWAGVAMQRGCGLSDPRSASPAANPGFPSGSPLWSPPTTWRLRQP